MSARAELGLIGVGMATAAVGTLVAAAHSAEQYQQSLTKLQVTAHLSDQTTAALGKTIMQTAMGTTASANTMAAALAPVSGELQRVVGHTLTSADANQVLAASQDLVESSGGNLTQSTKAITDLLLVYHKNAADAAQISDTLFQAHAQLGIGTDRLAMMLQRLQPRIAGSGVDMQHLLGIVRELSPTVGSGQRAMMVVGNVLQTLQNPSKMATAAFAALGFSVKDANGKFIGFEPAIEKIKQAYDRLGTGAEKAGFLQAIFGRQANVAMALIKGGAAGVEANTAALEANGTAAAAAAKMQGTLEGQQKTMEASLSTMTTAIGNALIPALSTLMQAITPVVTAIASWVEDNPQLTAAILAAVAAIGTLTAGAVVLGPAIATVGGLIGGLGTVAGIVATPLVALASPIGLVAIAVGALIVVLVKFTPIVSMVEGAIDALIRAFAPVVGAIMNVVKAIADFLGGRASLQQVGLALHALAATVIRALEDLAMQVVHWIGQAVPQFVAAFPQWVEAFVGWVADVLPKLNTELGKVADQIQNWIASTAIAIGSAAVDMGMQLIKGIIAGIAGMAAPLVNAIHSIPIIGNLMDIGGSVAGAAFSLGQQIAGGIAGGLAAGTPRVAAAAAGVAAAASAATLGATHVAPRGGGLSYSPTVAGPTTGALSDRQLISQARSAVSTGTGITDQHAQIIARSAQNATGLAITHAVTASAGTLTAATKAAIDKILGLAPAAAAKARHAATGGAGAGGYSPTGVASSLASLSDATQRADLQRQIVAATAAAASAKGTPGELVAKQHLAQLREEMAMLTATQGVTSARLSLKAAEAQLEKAHHQMMLAHEGRLKGVNAVMKAEADYRIALEKVTLAHSKMSLAEEKLAALKQAQATAATAATTGAAATRMRVTLGQTAEILPVGSTATPGLTAGTPGLSAALGAASSAGAAAGVAAAQAAAPTSATLTTLNVTTLNATTLTFNALARAAGTATVTAGGATPAAAELRNRGRVGVTAGAAGGFHGNVIIYMDGKVISGAISRILFEEERQYAGPINPLTGF